MTSSMLSRPGSNCCPHRRNELGRVARPLMLAARRKWQVQALHADEAAAVPPLSGDQRGPRLDLPRGTWSG